MQPSRRLQNSAAPLDRDTPPLEIWGGVEYTCNRVQDRYFDQMHLSGHAHRIEDLQAIRDLGVSTLRTGLLWERHEQDPTWQWEDARLSRMREADMRPIASLVHHGSGPRHTSLVDPEFPEKLASYAASVAERYPWIDAYTPVNEPNTTARFSALYGIWYPHHMSRVSYVRAMLHQVKGTVLSMREIRRVQPNARLIQTDDVGQICGTEALRSTCELINLRQWLTYDLLSGAVDRHHPMFEYMLREGVSEREILWFTENPCPPDVIGINYYVTSDRFLDDRLEFYPDRLRSAEGPFVDVDAVRVMPEGIAGVEPLIRRAWDEYRVPVAITEVHMGCTVDEQIRWLVDVWTGVKRARQAGAQVQALTVWALLGSYFWNQLVTCDNGYYEPGVFDVSCGQPEATELASVVAQLARGDVPSHPALERPGWWHHDDRVLYGYEDEIASAA